LEVSRVPRKKEKDEQDFSKGFPAEKSSGDVNG
jgi:hypothetical protein